MKNYLLRAGGIAALAVLLFTSATAQDTKDKDKDKDKEKSKVSKNDEVIIIRKSDKDAKVVVEIKDGAVTVNGQPLDEYKGDDVIVRRGRNLSGTRVYSPSPFSGQAWSYSSDDNHAYLGVTTDKDDKGARITEVTDNSAAEKAGLKEGDVITRVDDAKIEDHDDLAAAVRKHKPEEKVTITYLRDGKEQKATATLGKTGFTMSLTAPQVQTWNDHNFEFNNSYGQTFSYNARPRLGLRAQDTEDGKGVKVLSVDDESPADKAGIKKDDIITEFDGKAVNGADDLANAARNAKDKSNMTVKLTRAGKPQTLQVKIPKKLKTANL